MKKTLTSSKRDQYTAVLEDIRSHNKVFGESLGAVRDELKEVHEELNEVHEEVKDHSRRLSPIEADLEIIKNELAIIRHNQVTRDEFKLLETRVNRLEKAGRN